MSRIGEVAAGKTIDRILVAYDNPTGPGANRPPLTFDDGFDDITITGNPTQSTRDPVGYTPARPSDYVDTLRGTNTSLVPGRFQWRFPRRLIPSHRRPQRLRFWGSRNGQTQG